MDVMKILAKQRKDIVYLAPIEADILIGPQENTRIRLFHPGGGTAYAISYKPQKVVESFSGGDKPSVLFLGHFHKAGYFFTRNIHTFMAGCVEDQTVFMREKHIEAHRGYWKIDVETEKNGGIARICPEFTPFYT
jgi:hypothetical protein